MQSDGCTLAQILAAGQWRSNAFMAYLSKVDLEQEAVLELGMESDDMEFVD